MKRETIAVLAFALLCASMASAEQEQGGSSLRAGVAQADITPEPGLRMWGYSNRTAAATGTLDPLLARVLVIESDQRRLALVTLDLGRTPEEPLLDGLRRRIAERFEVEHLFVTASHTHQAPSLESYDGNANPYAAFVIGAIERAIGEALERLEPVRLGVGTGEVDVAHNRRRRLPDGRIAMQWRNAQREPTSPIDRELTVCRLDRLDGRPLAVLVHFACHPVVLGSDNLQYSADFVGRACAVVEEELGAPCLYLQGACGDINPYLDKTPLHEGGIEAMRGVGEEVGQRTAAIAHRIETRPAAGPLRVVQRNVPVRTRWDVEDPEVRQVLSRMYGARFDRYLAPALREGRLPLPLTIVSLADRLALVGMPGEIFVQFQLDLKARSPLPHTLLVGYTNGYHAYFPTIADAAAGGYGGKTATYVEVGAGERLRDEALVELHRIRGDLADVPRVEDFQLIEYDDIKASAEQP